MQGPNNPIDAKHDGNLLLERRREFGAMMSGMRQSADCSVEQLARWKFANDQNV